MPPQPRPSKLAAILKPVERVMARCCWLLVMGSICGLLAGCGLMQLQGELVDSNRQFVLTGHVECAETSGAPIVVLVLAGRRGSLEVVEQQALAHPGPFRLVLRREDTYVAAFEDRNRNGRWDEGEPVGHSSL